MVPRLSRCSKLRRGDAPPLREAVAKEESAIEPLTRGLVLAHLGDSCFRPQQSFMLPQRSR
jgi:hypothetical protein